MKKLLLILLLLFIQPVSNEQIQKNMGFQQPEIVYYQQQPECFQSTGPAKAPWRWETYTVTAADGHVFTVRYRTVVGSVIVYDVDGGGLDLDSWYFTKDDLINAINKALQDYNMSVPIGDIPICLLLLFGVSYCVYILYKQRNNVWK